MMIPTLMMLLIMVVRVLMIIPMTQPGSLCQGHPDEDDDDEDGHNARFPRTSLSEPPSLMLMVMTMLMTTMAHLSHDLEEQAPFLRRPSSTVIRHLVTLISLDLEDPSHCHLLTLIQPAWRIHRIVAGFPR